MDDIFHLDKADIAFQILYRFLKDELSTDELKDIIKDSYNFPVPVVELTNYKVLELTHGPTHAFKDIGARLPHLPQLNAAQIQVYSSQLLPVIPEEQLCHHAKNPTYQP